jgi:hypothetical protein
LGQDRKGRGIREKEWMKGAERVTGKESNGL